MTPELMAQAGDVARHVDACLIEAQAAAIEGNLQRAGELRRIATVWAGLVHVMLGTVDDE